MDQTIHHHNDCCKPEMGRGCTFCDCGNECEAKPCEGCFKLHETSWLEGYPDNLPTDIVEVRFKNTRRSFYQNVNHLDLKRGDIVAVEASPGHDIGIVSLTGDLVARQMRRTGFTPYNGEYKKIYRKAKPYDIERWQEAIALEHETMIASRQIAADMGLNMKIGDVEYQGDKIKAIFYYIADERVDFRELIKVFAERFHIRIEMKQIGARQEAGRIGGLGACGRELCCASWMSSFSSVTTGAARTQEISLNPQKLAGQCSKLKCCLMYEYDAYADARKEFPRLREPLLTDEGDFHLVKSDILSGTMSFSSSKDSMANIITLPVSRVKEILALNRAGKRAEQLLGEDDFIAETDEPTFRSEVDSITRFDNARKRNRRNRNRKESGRNGENGGRGQHAERRTNGNGTAERRANGAGEEPRPAEEHAAAPQHGGAGKERNRNDRQRRRNGNNNGGAERQGQPERQEPREERTAQAEGRGEGDENAARRRNNRGRNRHNHPRHNGAAGNGEERREASRTESNRQTTSEA